MILTQEKVKVETNFVGKRTEFTVKADGKLFSLLTKNVYANPVLSTISELCQNAWDSHVRAKKTDTPIKVTLPNYLSPNLVVRDFGVSMTEEFILNNYCVAFYSSKDTDNNQSGAFGLGRLAALSLSTTYTVVCYLKGERRSYSVFINNEGLPEILKTNSRETTEPDGVEISVPINTKDVHLFVSAAQAALKYYPTLPDVKGDSDFSYPEINKTLSGDGWYVDANLSKPTVVAGIYSYPLESANIQGLTEVQSRLINSEIGLTLVFEAGEVIPQVSRQGLYYNDKTVAAIKKRLESLEKDAKDEIQKAFDKCKTILEAKSLYFSYFSYGGAAVNLGRLLGSSPKVKWGKYDIEDAYLYTEKYVKDPVTQKDIPMSIPGLSCRLFQLQYRRGGYKVLESNIAIKQIDPNHGNLLFRNDLDGGRGLKYRLGYKLREAINTSPNGRNHHYYALTFATPQAEADFHETNGTTPEMLLSANSIVVPKGTSTASYGSVNPKHQLKVFKFVCDKYIDKESDYWEPTEVDVDEGGVYIPISRFVPSGMNNDYIENSIKRLIKHNVIKSVDLYGIKVNAEGDPKVLQEIRASTDWITFDKWLKEKVAQMVIDKAALQTIADANQAQRINSHLRSFKASGGILADYIKKADFIINQQNNAKKMQDLVSDYRALGGDSLPSFPTPTYDMEKETNLVHQHFPLLSLLGYTYIADKKNFHKYVEDTELANKLREKHSTIAEELVSA